MTITTMKLQLKQKPFIRVAWIYVSWVVCLAAELKAISSENKKLFIWHFFTLSILFLPPTIFVLFSLTFLEQIRKIGDQPLRDILKKLGGWPVIEPNWKPPNISIEKLMGKLRGEYSEPVLIELYVGADDKNSSINILQVRDWKSIEKEHFQFIFDLLSHLKQITVGSVSFGTAFKRLLS